MQEIDDASPRSGAERRERVLVVGSGFTFFSGISLFTYFLSDALDEVYDVSTILLRKLIPKFLYPGRDRVGPGIVDYEYSDPAKVFDGIDWFAIPSLFKAMRFLRRERPDVVIFEWWTGAVLHTFLALLYAARRSGSKIIVEYHEVEAVGEGDLPLLGRYSRWGFAKLSAAADAHVVHSTYDQKILAETAAVDPGRVFVIPHGSYDFGVSNGQEHPEAPLHDPGALRLLYFGVIRPYKGLEVLAKTFDEMDASDAAKYHLTVIGEVWEGYRTPLDMMGRGPNADRIEVIDRYVSNDELVTALAEADVVVLPYTRSSASGPLHTAMSAGIPVVVTAVGGLKEVASLYEGAVLVRADDSDDLHRGIEEAQSLRGKRFPDPFGWSRTADLYRELITSLL